RQLAADRRHAADPWARLLEELLTTSEDERETVVDRRLPALLAEYARHSGKRVPPRYLPRWREALLVEVLAATVGQPIRLGGHSMAGSRVGRVPVWISAESAGVWFRQRVLGAVYARHWEEWRAAAAERRAVQEWRPTGRRLGRAAGSIRTGDGGLEDTLTAADRQNDRAAELLAESARRRVAAARLVQLAGLTQATAAIVVDVLAGDPPHAV